MTRRGVILGTAAYMSPEQARGRAVDKRADIWAFGCLLYEMLSGRRLFAGDDLTETIAAVVKEQPDLSVVPRKVRRLLGRCLDKDPKRRLHDIGDAWDLLQDDAAAPPLPSRGARILSNAALIVAGVAVGFPIWMIASRDETATPEVSRFVEPLPAGRWVPVGTDDPARRSAVAISPDGRTVAYSAAERGTFRVYRRFIDELGAVPIGDVGAERPFFSADGQWIAYCIRGTAADSGIQTVLKRVSVPGGPAQVIMSGVCPTDLGATWNADGTILVGGSAATGMRRIPVMGGEPTIVTKRADGRAIQDPQLLPGNRAILYTATRLFARDDAAEVFVHDIQTGNSEKLLNGRAAHYLTSGHLVFVRQNSLWAVAFDLSRLAVRGSPVPVIEGLRLEGWTPVAHMAISDSGVLAYLPGIVSNLRTLVWVDREGQEEALGIEPRQYQAPRVSPDGQLIALPIGLQNEQLWIWDIARKSARKLGPETYAHLVAAWYPDSKRLAFSARAEDSTILGWVHWQAADGSGVASPLYEKPPEFQAPLSFLRNGDSICMVGTANIGLRKARDDGACRPLFTSPAIERNASVSPDGRWLAFESDRTQRGEIYVRPFPNVNDAEWTITTDGGCCAVWSRDGRELYYWKENGESISIMAVPLASGRNFEWDRRHVELVRGPYAKPSVDTSFDVFAGRFLLMKSTAPQPPNQIVIVLNWFDELKRLVPTQ